MLLSLQIFALSAVAAGALATPTKQTPIFLPVYYSFGNYPKISTDILWGTPEQKQAVKTVVDLGSADFWVFGPNSTLNYGSTDLGGIGPCNQTIKPFYKYPASKTSTKPVKNSQVYSYGGNSKFIFGYHSVNDTINFGNAPSIKNRRVEVANFTTLRQADDGSCSKLPVDSYDHSILGISPYVANKSPPIGTSGPSFRQDLLKQGFIKSSTLSMWFDKAPADAPGNYTFRGTTLFGAIPQHSKYSGDLVLVKPDPPKDAYVGYYVSTPVVAASNVKSNQTSSVTVLQNSPRCLIDSGSGQDTLPINQKSFLQATGLVNKRGVPAYQGSCDDIPFNATVDYTFTGLNSKKVTVKVPLKNYARDTQFVSGFCMLSMSLGIRGECTFGAPFVSGAFLAFNDEKNQIAIAQGFVSSGADQGVAGLGPVKYIPSGQGLI